MKISDPSQTWMNLKNRIKRQWVVVFVATFLMGIITHATIMLQDIPNHDGLASMYFDQNMITSGRWFLGVACGFSSYFTLPWLIGFLGLMVLAVTAVLLTDLLCIENSWLGVLVGGLLVTFPALVSTFAYVYTLDGYMVGLMLSVLAVWFTSKGGKKWLAGAACLAFSMGVYQAYLPFAILLSLYMVLISFVELNTVKEKIQEIGRYLGMGVLGVVLYYVILRVLLLIQGKQLASYQGIDGMGSLAGLDLVGTIKTIFADFLEFSLKGHVLFNNIFSALAMVGLLLASLVILVRLAHSRGLYKCVWFYLILLALFVVVPVASNVILIISPGVNYHLLMRYQWVLFVILLLAFCNRYVDLLGKRPAECKWIMLVCAFVLVFNYLVVDQIAYSNLDKKYEKTYSYCLRLLDRMEQTEGYYPGIPVAMIGVVGSDNFPVTDITDEVTGSIIGTTGDYLLYTSANYASFMKHYLGVELKTVSEEDMLRIYDSEAYRALDSFPGKNSMKVVDGVLYVKTENIAE